MPPGLKDPTAVVARSPDLQTWSHEFGDIIMPNQNLAEGDIDALIAYMKEFPPPPQQP